MPTPAQTEARRVVIADVGDREQGESIVLERLTALPGVELIGVESSQRLWRVFHEKYGFCIVPRAGNDPRGTSQWWYRGATHVARTGAVMLTEPGEMHITQRMERPARHYWIVELEPALLATAASELGISAPPHLRMAQSYSPRVFGAFCRWQQSFDDPDSLRQQSGLAEAIRVLFEECGEQRPNVRHARGADGLRAARDYLHAHFRESISLQTLASIAGVSRFHLVHAFARTYGVPPHRYQNYLRIADAQRQLRAGLPAAHVDAGFADQSHLTRHFKRIAGMTPGEYGALHLRAVR
ncbi:MAG TPA: AraC family transcriptional regulator [Thermoanaerobaculia bacterium]|nr:AraC family transcriptional regulator [Thermoanaerobaculia bacterium]